MQPSNSVAGGCIDQRTHRAFSFLKYSPAIRAVALSLGLLCGAEPLLQEAGKDAGGDVAQLSGGLV